MYKQLQEINTKPKLFEFYTAELLWADSYTSKQMLYYHLNPDIDLASRNKEFINKSVDWIVSEFSINQESRICDFGCAVGLYTSALAKTGASVTGIDFSKSSIDYAENFAIQEGLNINYIWQNYLEYESNERYDLITMIMCDFCVLSPEQRKLLLDKFYKLLDANGSVLLDVSSLKGFEEKQESATYEYNQLNKFWSPNDYYGFVNTFKYEDEKVTLDKYTIIEEQSSKVIYNWFGHFSIEMLRNEFESAGFIIKEVYKDVAGSKYEQEHTEFAVVAVKA
ncbi:cyclopropane-fatty-acyl-phospholipid synthase family protein [Sulfurimonas sp.]|uniref:SAM-dependent methyltransferase n=1 Tax=Sulfurimonas sp. TaxID=2022749 RepID=UPI0035699D3C